MNTVTLILPVYNQPAQWRLCLSAALCANAASERRALRLIVTVDDCSDEPLPAPDPAAGVHLEGYRITTRAGRWNAGGARNLGFHVAPVRGLCLVTDIDHLLVADVLDELADLDAVDQFSVPKRRATDGTPVPAGNSIYACPRAVFWATGPYHEACNYGVDAPWHTRRKASGFRLEYLRSAVTVTHAKAPAPHVPDRSERPPAAALTQPWAKTWEVPAL
jgi:hypothetical protein